MRFESHELEIIFNQCFQQSHQTCLKGGFEEPIYLPNTQTSLAIIGYRDDYFSSALHEIAHWCLAGEQRRLKQDYGYWYIANRDVKQQQAFLNVEVKPQALEAYFSDILGYPFTVSLDHFSTLDAMKTQFQAAVQLQLQQYQTHQRMSREARLFSQQLAALRRC